MKYVLFWSTVDNPGREYTYPKIIWSSYENTCLPEGEFNGNNVYITGGKGIVSGAKSPEDLADKLFTNFCKLLVVRIRYKCHTHTSHNHNVFFSVMIDRRIVKLDGKENTYKYPTQVYLLNYWFKFKSPIHCSDGI